MLGRHCPARRQLGPCGKEWHLAPANRVWAAKMVTSFYSWWKAPPELERRHWKTLVFATFIGLRYWTGRQFSSRVQNQAGRLPTLRKFRIPRIVPTMESGQLAYFSSFRHMYCKGPGQGLWFSCADQNTPLVMDNGTKQPELYMPGYKGEGGWRIFPALFF